MNFRPLAFFACIFVFPLLSSAQVKETSAWGAWFNSTRISKKVGVHFDGQVRSSNDVESVKNVLIRPGVTWFIDDSKNVTAGYALVKTFNRADGAASNNLTEHRIWEQFIYAHKISPLNLTHRLRLEQRFIEQASQDVFSQRLRYFVRALVPLRKPDDVPFSKGAFFALQNEVFLNIQNKDELNGSLVDQNRAYAAVGYRFSPAVDLEAGYLNQAIKGSGRNVLNNVIQLAVYTRF